MQIDVIFGVLVLLFSVILHEVAHGYMADYLGDPTARHSGRLTLNPISHIDPFGSVILPALLALTHSPFLIGYAKPVPYNPYNLRGFYGEALVAFAGPATNIALALLFGLTIRFFGALLSPALVSAFAVVVYINILLALFNLVPLPPLDGSKVLSAILPTRLALGYHNFRASFERLGMFSGLLLILVFLYLFSPFFFALLRSTFTLLTGVGI
ncbi:site-2 protease family protein [Patescibacteria group bacterium]|nr:site-2 protease family protein [Patescibacteria group bacterium]